MHCRECGAEWEFQSLPLFILTGCSGVGKTTTAIEIIRKKVDFVVFDADIFAGFINWNDEESCNSWVELIENITKDIMQSGKPVLWTMAGCLERLPKAYNSRYFSEIIVLALVTDENALRQRMQEGRGITDDNWINSSCDYNRDYNRYFKEHTQIRDTKFEILVISTKASEEVADYVVSRVKKRLISNS